MTTLLLIDDDAQRREHLTTNFRFAGFDCRAMAFVDWMQQPDLAEGVTLAFIGRCSLPVSLDKLLALLQVKGQRLAACLLEAWDDIADLSAASRHQLCGVIEGELSAAIVTDLLHESYVRSGAGSQMKPPSPDLVRRLVGSHPVVCKVRTMIEQVATRDAGVLITGESGTGKEVVARCLHDYSSRREGPFVPVNCGAIPAELLESELFGHEKGAFTGAISSRAGRFEMAQGGTLFLDEIGDMPLPMQVKLLRVLQERQFERVGSSKTRAADVRIVAATHKNLEEMIETGEFREDLYYRLNIFPIEMPALRERIDDIPLLLEELVSRMQDQGQGRIRFHESALLSLKRHPWPGNVREMANLVERLTIMHPDGVIGVSELPPKFRHIDEPDPQRYADQQAEIVGVQSEAGLHPLVLPAEGINLKAYLEEQESDLISQALDACEGVVARAAERLSIRRTTLVEKMRKYGISRK